MRFPYITLSIDIKAKADIEAIRIRLDGWKNEAVLQLFTLVGMERCCPGENEMYKRKSPQAGHSVECCS